MRRPVRSCRDPCPAGPPGPARVGRTNGSPVSPSNASLDAPSTGRSRNRRPRAATDPERDGEHRHTDNRDQQPSSRRPTGPPAHRLVHPGDRRAPHRADARADTAVQTAGPPHPLLEQTPPRQPPLRPASQIRGEPREQLRLVGRHFVERRVQPLLVEAAEDRRGGAVRGDDDEGGLGRDAEMVIQVTVGVFQLRERELMTFDEVPERRVITSPRDTVDLRLAGPASSNQLDRAGFGVTDASSRRPEPQHHRPTSERTAGELPATNDGSREPEAVGHRGPLGRRLCRLRPGSASTAGDEPDADQRHQQRSLRLRHRWDRHHQHHPPSLRRRQPAAAAAHRGSVRHDPARGEICEAPIGG